MDEPLKLMCVMSHPDDESLGVGATLARYRAEGVEIHLVTATRGERGWFGAPEENPGLEELGRIREAELGAAARVLGLESFAFLDYIDGDLDRADATEAAARIAHHVRRVKPHVVRIDAEMAVGVDALLDGVLGQKPTGLPAGKTRDLCERLTPQS